MTWSDPGAPAGVPKTIKQIKLRFHPGTHFDTSALARCQASDDEIKSKGASACPAGSRLGAGNTEAVLGSGVEFTTDVTLFNSRGEIIVLVTLHGVPVTEFRDRVRGRTITVNPALPAGVALTELNLRIDPHSKGSGAQRKSYMRTPRVCPASRSWTTVARFTYADRSTQTFQSASPCRRGRSG
jgi:hypothetical protein